MSVFPNIDRTEFGTIPANWDVVPLGALCDSITDGTHFTPRYVQDGVPFYSVENITADDFTNTKFISQEEHRLLIKRCKPERGDILMTRITAGVLGATRIIDWEVNASIYVSLALLKPNVRVVPEYLYHYTKSNAFLRDVERRALVNATPKKINMRDIGAIPIPVPRSEHEQRSIVSALTDMDALVTGLDQLLAKKFGLKQAAMQQLLSGQIRLSGYEGQWKEKQLGELAQIKTGSRNNEDKNDTGEYPFFVRSEVIERINSYSHDCEAILVPGEGRIGSIFHYINGRFDVHQRVYAITRFRPDVDARFIHLYMTMKFGAWAMQNTVKATVDSLRLPTFQTFSIYFPPSKNEQTAIAAVISDMDTELALLEQQRKKARDIKQAMMQELLTGKTRLIPRGDTHA